MTDKTNETIKGLVTDFTATMEQVRMRISTLAVGGVDFAPSGEVRNTIMFSLVARIVCYLQDRVGDGDMLNYGFIVSADAFDNFTTIKGSAIPHPVWDDTLKQFTFMGIPIHKVDNTDDFGGISNACVFLYYRDKDGVIDANIIASIHNPYK